MSAPPPYKSVEEELETMRKAMDRLVKTAGLKVQAAPPDWRLQVSQSTPQLMFLWPYVSSRELLKDDHRGFIAAVNANAIKLMSDFVLRCSLAPSTFQADEIFVSSFYLINGCQGARNNE